jgi:hypothetical protein
MRRRRSLISVLSSRPIFAPLFLARGRFIDASSEGKLGLRGAFIFAVLVALLHACKQSSDRALARCVLSCFEHLRKAFKELSVPHTRSIQAQILSPSLTPNKSLNPRAQARVKARAPSRPEKNYQFG